MAEYLQHHPPQIPKPSSDYGAASQPRPAFIPVFAALRRGRPFRRGRQGGPVRGLKVRNVIARAEGPRTMPPECSKACKAETRPGVFGHAVVSPFQGLRILPFRPGALPRAITSRAFSPPKSDAEAIALQKLRDCHAASNFAKRLDCGRL